LPVSVRFLIEDCQIYSVAKRGKVKRDVLVIRQPQFVDDEAIVADQEVIQAVRVYHLAEMDPDKPLHRSNANLAGAKALKYANDPVVLGRTT
jgi:hypothetical protein